MSTRTLQPLSSQRGGAIVNGNPPGRKKPFVVASSGVAGAAPSRSTSLRSAPARPSRGTTTVTVSASSRKVSAPSKLISAIGDSLESLPETVTVRRKVSAPVRSANPTGARPSKQFAAKRASSTVVAPVNPKKKFSCNSNTLGPLRMSKDHTGTSSANSQTPSSSGTKGPTPTAGSSAPAAAAAAAAVAGAPEASKSSKKGPYALPEVQPLPTLKEEKKPKGKHKKMSSSAPLSADPPEETLMPPKDPAHDRPSTPNIDDAPEPNLRRTFPLNLEAAPAAARVAPAGEEAPGSAPGPGPVPEKSNLEKMVSDLMRNNESKKQEIAALKMEINRLKDAARERLQAAAAAAAASEAAKDERQPPPADEENNAASHDDAGGSRMADEAEESQLESVVASLWTENRLLRDHLHQLGVSLDASPLSDHQKEIILSRVSAFSQSGLCGENLSAVTASLSAGEKDWDNKSSSSISEISVACLQGRIQQMEETHYSTNEELQATLQELEDLREQLSECQMEVQQLQEEKQVILESLTQQTEKLNEARGYNDTLKLMLIQQSENSQDVSLCERTQRLMELLKSVQEDKELTELKQDELDQQAHASKEAEEHFHREAQLIRDRMKLLESMVESATKDKQSAETRLLEAHERIKVSEKEASRLKSSLATAKEKITDLEAAVISGEKSELADVLERVCGEKEAAEREVTALQRKASALACENDRLKEQVAALQESLRVTRNNAKTNLDDVEWRRTQTEERVRSLECEAESLRGAVAEAQLASQHHLEDKRSLKAGLSEAQKKAAEAGERRAEAERGLAQERAAFARQMEEWDQFQKDLLTSVRVANDFKTEAQRSLEKAEVENNRLKERIRALDAEIEKARAAAAAASKVPAGPAGGSLVSSSLGGGSAGDRRMFKGGLASGDAILGDRRSNPRPLARGDSRVKSLIESIECATKQTKASSRSSSTSSIASTGSENNNNNSNGGVKAPFRKADSEGVMRPLPPSLTSPLKESLSSNSSPLRALHCNSLSPPDPLSPLSSFYKPGGHNPSSNLPDTVKMSQLSSEKKNSVGGGYPPVGAPDSAPKQVSILGNKIEPLRRNSYNQVTSMEKKDPLATLSQAGGSKRNALLKWCQSRTSGYKNVDITNFSSSWNDGLAFCALLDTYMPHKIEYSTLNLTDKRTNFEIAFNAAESVGISTNLDINDMMTLERPTWQSVFNYVTSIYSHFET